MSTQLANFINNQWNFPETETLEVRNPATTELLAVVPLTGPDLVDQAVDAASAAKT